GDMILVSAQEGVWRYTENQVPSHFTEVSFQNAPLLLMEGAVQDPMGGVYIYNSSIIFHYRKDQGIIPLLDARDLLGATLAIQDISAGSDGTVWIATDAGIFRHRDGRVDLYLGKSQEIFGGIVRVIFADGQGRCWFAMPGFAGYYIEKNTMPVVLDVQPPETGTIPAPVPTGIARPPPARTGTVAEPGTSDGSWLDPVVDAIHAIQSILEGILNGH
ncbi:MAG: hypothetical protein LUQ13_00330, partial [Methanomicrobiales archaeon]|nr:hypothetical protein [Methanomicrobiales archaeon]